MKPEVWIGTSGYVYKHWRNGVFYPPGLPAKEELPFYAQHFRTVELNNPFYRLPPRATFVSWRRRTPDDFLFAVKASRYITHIKKLKDAGPPLRLFLHQASGLGKKFGPVLFQFPRTWKPDIGRLRDFLALLPRRREFAFEFRHPGWLSGSVYELLQSHDAALCLAAGPAAPQTNDVVTARFSYIRMHGGSGEGGNFTGKELRNWAARIERFRADGVKVYIYFNNDQCGYAIQNAFALRRLLRIER
jgi:uncharacterized protein YecE (DUF72 family)